MLRVLFAYLCVCLFFVFVCFGRERTESKPQVPRVHEGLRLRRRARALAHLTSPTSQPSTPPLLLLQCVFCFELGLGFRLRHGVN